MTETAARGSSGLAELVFLHTAPVHAQSFDALLRELRPSMSARHVVREDLLGHARAAGSDHPDVVRAVADAIAGIAGSDSSVLLCTCSTIGGCAESAEASSGIRVVRVDRAMAKRAVKTGRRILLVAAVAGTVAPTESLILEEAASAGREVEIRRLLVDDAWILFEQGEFDAYLQRVATAIAQAPACDVAVLAQASMAGAADLCPGAGVPVLSSPRLGLECALALVDAAAGASARR